MAGDNGPQLTPPPPPPPPPQAAFRRALPAPENRLLPPAPAGRQFWRQRTAAVALKVGPTAAPAPESHPSLYPSHHPDPSRRRPARAALPAARRADGCAHVLFLSSAPLSPLALSLLLPHSPPPPSRYISPSISVSSPLHTPSLTLFPSRFPLFCC
jgi:hypothetical protein